MTANGTFDANQGGAASGYGDYGDSFVKLSTQGGAYRCPEWLLHRL